MHEFQCISSSIHFHHTFPLIECDLCVGKARDLGVAKADGVMLLRYTSMKSADFYKCVDQKIEVLNGGRGMAVVIIG